MRIEVRAKLAVFGDRDADPETARADLNAERRGQLSLGDESFDKSCQIGFGAACNNSGDKFERRSTNTSQPVAADQRPGGPRCVGGIRQSLSTNYLSNGTPPRNAGRRRAGSDTARPRFCGVIG